jgi:hypothetical protein
VNVEVSTVKVAAEPKPKSLAVEDDETMLHWLSWATTW